MSRNPQHKEYIKKHVRSRLLERYGLRISQRDYNELIKLSKYKFLDTYKITNTKSIRLIKFKSQLCAVLYSSSIQMILTALPSDTIKANKLDKDNIWLREK